MLPLCALMISDVGDVPVGAAAAPANDGASAVAISVQALEPCSGGAREGNVGVIHVRNLDWVRWSRTLGTPMARKKRRGGPELRV